MFHHTHLLPNEYHFRDYSAKVHCQNKREVLTPENAMLSVTSHHLFIDYELARNGYTLHQSTPLLGNSTTPQRSLLLKINLSSIESMEEESLRELRLVVSAYEEISSSTIDEVITESATSFLLTGFNTEFVDLLASVRQLALMNSNETQFNTQMEALIVKHELVSIESAIRYLDTHGLATILHSTVINIDLYFRDRGLLILTDKSLFYFPFKSSESEHSCVDLASILRVVKKPWRMHRTAMEIYFESWSVFVAFTSQKERDSFYSLLRKLPSVSQNQFTLEEYKAKWNDRLIGNYEYIMALNDESGRSLKDIDQYPIFPWVLKQYDSLTIDISNPAYYRDFSTVKQQKLNAENVTRYLQRKHPLLFTPKHTFIGIAEEYEATKTKDNSIGELIPEFYSETLSFFSGGNQLNAVKLPTWTKNSQDFILVMKAALESSITDKSIHKWIDHVFGVNQITNATMDYTDQSLSFMFPNSALYKVENCNPEQIFMDNHTPRRATFEIGSEVDQVMTLKEQMKSIQLNSELEIAKKDELIQNLRQIVEVLEKKMQRVNEMELYRKMESDDTGITQKDVEIKTLRLKNRELTEEMLRKTQELEEEKEKAIRQHKQVIDELADQLLRLQAKHRDLEEKFNAQNMVKNKLKSHSPNSAITNWEAMFNELTGKYDQLYKSYKMIVEERATLKTKNRDISTLLGNTEKQFDKEIKALEVKLQQTIKEKMTFYDKQLELENKYNLLLSDNRQLKINMHFLEQKIREDTKLREKTQSLLSDASIKPPTTIGLYNTKQYGSQDSTETSDLENRSSTPESTPLSRVRTPTRTKSPIRAPRQELSLPSSPKARSSSPSIRSTSPSSRTTSPSVRSSSPSTASPRIPSRTSVQTPTRTSTRNSITTTATTSSQSYSTPRSTSRSPARTTPVSRSSTAVTPRDLSKTTTTPLTSSTRSSITSSPRRTSVLTTPASPSRPAASPRRTLASSSPSRKPVSSPSRSSTSKVPPPNLNHKKGTISTPSKTTTSTKTKKLESLSNNVDSGNTSPRSTTSSLDFGEVDHASLYE